MKDAHLKLISISQEGVTHGFNRNKLSLRHQRKYYYYYSDESLSSAFKSLVGIISWNYFLREGIKRVLWCIFLYLKIFQSGSSSHVQFPGIYFSTLDTYLGNRYFYIITKFQKLFGTRGKLH
uniref:Uncharacterized protein n=1 Tax=Cacopsylla melanoneura TaxID=428564 RepID=A0A8D9BQ69_9HEMI